MSAESSGVDLSANIREMVQRAQTSLGSGERRFGPNDPVPGVTADVIAQIGHLLAVVNDQLLILGDQVGALRSANRELLARLYPPNEVYVAVTNGDAR